MMNQQKRRLFYYYFYYLLNGISIPFHSVWIHVSDVHILFHVCAVYTDISRHRFICELAFHLHHAHTNLIMDIVRCRFLVLYGETHTQYAYSGNQSERCIGRLNDETRVDLMRSCQFSVHHLLCSID